MALILIALCVGLGAADAKTYYITGDGGGSVYDNGRRWEALRNDYIVVDGPCYSSCTMVLGNYPNVCVTKRADLGFHRGYTRVLWIGPFITDKAATDYMMAHFPPDIQAMINARGGLLKYQGGIFIPRLIKVKPSELPAKYRCK
jgi:hypothetical protein